MPLPEPRPDEEHDEFIERCMEETAEEFEDPEQRRAVCEQQWEGARDVTDNVVPINIKGRAKPYEIKARDSVGEVFLFDEIGGTFDGTTAKQFAADLKAIGNVETLNIFINSPGGVVFEGVAISSILKRHPANKIVHIDGLAASIASVIAMAGDEIRIALNGMMMIHDPWSIAFGTAEDMRREANALDKVRQTILASYVARASAPEDQLSEWMSAETWFTAAEAVEAGLADTITDEVAIAALVKHDLSKFKHVPEPLNQHDDDSDETEEQDSRPHPAVVQMRARALKRGLKRQAPPA